MAIKPELNVAKAYEKIKANKYNENFDILLNYIEEVSEELELKVNTINSQLASSVLSNLQSVYPIGSLCFGTTENCPLSNLFGTWEKVGAGLITNIEELKIKGNGNILGLTEGNNYGGIYFGSSSAGAGVHTVTPIPLKAGGSASSTGNFGTFKYLGVSTDPEKSGLIGEANFSKIEINVWKRTA
jgi:hypothetical protein